MVLIANVDEVLHLLFFFLRRYLLDIVFYPATSLPFGKEDLFSNYKLQSST